LDFSRASLERKLDLRVLDPEQQVAYLRGIRAVHVVAIDLKQHVSYHNLL